MLDEKKIQADENPEENRHTSVMRINLKENKVVSYQLSDRADKRLKERLKANRDYRQLMLNYVLEHLLDSDKERVIQTLMPERLLAQMSFRKQVVCEFCERRNETLLFFRLEIKKDENNPQEVLFDVKVTAEEKQKKKEYIIGSNYILMLGNDAYLGDILKDNYELTFAQSAEDAEKFLENQWNRTAAIMILAEHTDRDELMNRIQKNPLYQTIPVVVIAGSAAEIKEEQLLNQGATEILIPSCTTDILKKRILGVIHCHELEETVKRLEKDPQTGTYRKESFYRYASQMMQEKPDESYETIIFQIFNFRALQGKYGETITGMVIDFIVNHIRKALPGILCMGRFSDGEFAVLRQGSQTFDYDSFLKEIHDQAPVRNLALKAGSVYAEKNDTIHVLCDRAQKVVHSIENTYGVFAAVYDEKMRLNDRRVQNILDNMEAGLEQNQFEVYYQPKHCATTEKVCGAEALVRWIHPEYGFMNPGEFIPVFEKVGFIRGLDRYIFAKVCQNIVRWKAMGLPLFPVSVNLSRRDFEMGDLADWIINLTKNMHVEPELVHIEVTETAYTDNPEQISACLERLHEAGFSIELDDFGVGYSSLTVLADITVDILKLDRSIIEKDVPGEPKNILEFCMQLAKIMNLKTVAEGVETEAQRNRMQDLGCNYIQGYYYAAPMKLEKFEEYLRKNK